MDQIQSLMYSSSSLLMGLLFTYSAAAQLNDQDWYFWLPLYSFAAAVTLLQVIFSTSSALRQVAVLTLWGGCFLLLKAVLEDFVYGLSGFWSLDMREKVVRENVGSCLVVASMVLHVKASQCSRQAIKGQSLDATSSFVVNGMAILVAVSYGLSFYFFLFVKDNAMFS